LRVGIFGGAFNPPHIGHLVCAQEALLQLQLESVLFVPVGQAPHRELDNDPGPETRLEMVELALEDDDRFAGSRMEIDRDGPSYTSDTLRELHTAAPDDEHVLILGGDQAAALPEWHEPEQVLELAQVAVVERSNWSRNAVGIRVGRLKGADRIRYLDMPVIQVSSSSIRRRIAAGLPIRYLVPDRVASFIDSKDLYATASVGASPVAEASS
jgi:nicotinate-nucleotide adenylyltransferase